MTGFIRNIAGTVVSCSVAAFVSSIADLQLIAFIIFAIQWIGALVYAIPKQDERYLDITGSFTYAAVSLFTYLHFPGQTWRSTVLIVMVWLWCVRLGTFLFIRIGEQGRDSRFSEIRVAPLRFFSVWNIQGLWVFLAALPVFLNLTHSTHDVTLTVYDVAGAALWVIGYVIEVVADYQKTQFRRNPANKGDFIHTGLWYYSRHPNYFGEITLWIGVFLVSVHTLPLTSYKWLAALSPTFVALLLFTVSGIPVLEKQGMERWGSSKEYQKYVATTSVLVLWPKKST